MRDRIPRILVVEDTADLRELFASELERAGFVVVQAGDGAVAIEKAREFMPDVIVLDLMLPVVNGITVAQVVRHFSGVRQSQILAVTALTSPGVLHAAEVAGCDSFITKPTTAKAVVEEVRRMLSVSRPALAASGGAEGSPTDSEGPDRRE